MRLIFLIYHLACIIIGLINCDKPSSCKQMINLNSTDIEIKHEIELNFDILKTDQK